MPKNDVCTYNTPEPMRVTWNCGYKTTTLIFEERGIFHNSHHCHKYSKYFSLLAYLWMKYLQPQQKKILVEPPVSALFSPFKTEVLINNITNMKRFQMLQNYVSTNMKDIQQLL